MLIRNFLKEDLAQLLELCREVRQHHIDILNGYFLPQDDRYEQLAFLESLTNDKIIALVAAENDEICGYLLASLTNAPYLVNPDVARVENFGVSAKHRRKGIGKKLMDTFLKICKEKGIQEIRLGVYNENLSAYKFYENYGFKPLEQRMILDLSK